MNISSSNRLGQNIVSVNVKEPGKAPMGGYSMVCSFRPLKGAQPAVARGQRAGSPSSSLLCAILNGFLCKPKVGWEFQGENAYILKFNISHALKSQFLLGL